MTTFARIASDSVTDLCTGSDVETAVGQAFAAGYIQTVGGLAAWLQVPDGTLPGSTGDGHGGYTPPAQTAPEKHSVKMSGKVFTNYCAMVLAQVNKTDATGGLLRLDQIIGAMQASTAPLMALAKSSWQAALTPGGEFTLADATMFFAYLVANGSPATMTATEESALVSGWLQQ